MARPSTLPHHTQHVPHPVLCLGRLVNAESSLLLQFLDDGAKVKVYIPLEGVGAAISDDCVSCSFQPKSLEVGDCR